MANKVEYYSCIWISSFDMQQVFASQLYIGMYLWLVIKHIDKIYLIAY